MPPRTDCRPECLQTAPQTCSSAYRELEVGGVVINDASSFRVDHMPYGGVKESGMGREGVRYAIEEMTEMKLLSLNFS